MWPYPTLPLGIMFLNKLESTLQYWSAISVCAASSIIVEIVSYKSIKPVASQTIPKQRGSSLSLVLLIIL